MFVLPEATVKTSDQSGPISQGQEVVSCLGYSSSLSSPKRITNTNKPLIIRWNSPLSPSSELLGLYI